VSYQIRFTPSAADELQCLFDFLAINDVAAAERARWTGKYAKIAKFVFPIKSSRGISKPVI